MRDYVRRISYGEKAFTPRLEELYFELTERCNNDCIHCCINLPEHDEDAGRRELTTEQARGILIQAVELGCLQVRFTGGEPLLRKDFMDLYVFARKLGLRVQIYTNARLITSQLAELFARIPPLSPIEVTVYGMHPESYEAVTNTPGSYEQFRHGVNLLLACNVPFKVKFALMPQNRADVEEFESLARTIPGMTHPPYVLFFDLRERRDNERKNRSIESLRLPPEEGASILMKSEKNRKALSEFMETFPGEFSDRIFVCGACEGGAMCIDAYGRAQPCMGIRAPALTCDLLGAQNKASLKYALDRFAFLRDLRANNPDYLRRCSRCFLKGLCEQCPAKSWAEHGTLDTPVEYFCEVAHAMARHVGWLGEGEKGWEVKSRQERTAARKAAV